MLFGCPGGELLAGEVRRQDVIGRGARDEEAEVAGQTPEILATIDRVDRDAGPETDLSECAGDRGQTLAKEIATMGRGIRVNVVNFVNVVAGLCEQSLQTLPSLCSL